MRPMRRLIVLAVVSMLLGACGNGAGEDESTSTTIGPATTATEAEHEEGEDEDQEHMERAIDATSASITVDGDASEWDAVPGLDVTLESIQGVDVESKAATVKVAHDGENVYVLLTVEDDYNWNADDPHLSASLAVMWSVDTGAGPHMGTDDDAGEGPSLGMVDIWHWELECGLGEEQGGRVSGPGEGFPGNDDACNFDDEFATDPETRFDDGDTEGPAGSGSENSLLGVFSHTDPTEDASGTWIFEMSRPLETGDSQDGQLTVGETALLALAYWDPDNSVEGWDDDQHVQSSNGGWIEVLIGS
jgi:hypothetical protein